MDIVECGDSQRGLWNTFVGATPRGSFYHLFEWKEVNERGLDHRCTYLAGFDRNEIVGVYPIVRIRSRTFGDIACSMPFVNYGGPCGTTDLVEDTLVAEGIRVAKSWGVDFLEIRTRRQLASELPPSTRKVSLTVSLEAGCEELWKSFKTAHRQDIRRGYKNGFIGRTGSLDLLDDFYSVLAESWRDLGTPIYAKSYFETVIRTFSPFIRVCVVYSESQPVAASLQAHWGETAEGLWLGSRQQYRRQHAGYVLYWELLKDAAQQGCRRFHLGRSTSDSGAEAFKRKWNATADPLFWHHVLVRRPGMPAINVDNPKYRAAIWLWRRLPVPVAVLIGQRVAPYIP